MNDITVANIGRRQQGKLAQLKKEMQQLIKVHVMDKGQEWTWMLLKRGADNTARIVDSGPLPLHEVEPYYIVKNFTSLYEGGTIQVIDRRQTPLLFPWPIIRFERIDAIQ